MDARHTVLKSPSLSSKCALAGAAFAVLGASTAAASATDAGAADAFSFASAIVSDMRFSCSDGAAFAAKITKKIKYSSFKCVVVYLFILNIDLLYQFEQNNNYTLHLFITHKNYATIKLCVR